MKKHLWILALCCLLLLLPVAAAAEEALPVEWVRFGYGLPTSAAADMHELKEENITLEGALFETTVRNGKVYVSFLDLASAKLLTEHGAELEKLGIALGDLKIADGQLQLLRQDTALSAKLESFLKDKKVALSVGDSFHLGNGAEEKLIVRIGGFETEPEGNSSKGESGTQKAKSPVDVKSAQKSTDRVIPEEKRPEVTTVYLFYNGTTTYTERYEPPAIQSSESGREREPEQTVQTRHAYSLYVSLAYSQEDKDANVQYYVSIALKNGGEDSTMTALDAETREDIGGNPITYAAFDTVGQDGIPLYGQSGRVRQNTDGDRTLPEIIISRDRNGKDIVKKIHFVDKTPEYADILENWGSAPEGYTENQQESGSQQLQLDPDKASEVLGSPLDETDVTVEVRDDIILKREELKPLSQEEQPGEAVQAAPEQTAAPDAPTQELEAVQDPAPAQDSAPQSTPAAESTPEIPAEEPVVEE